MLVGLLLVALTFVSAGGPVAAAGPGPTGAFDRPPAHQRSVGDPSGRIGGQLAGLVRAAQAGTLDHRAYAGFETARAPLEEGVAVALRLAEAKGEDALRALLAAGGRIANRRGRDLEAYLPAAALRLLPNLSGIERADPIIRPIPLGNAGLGLLGEGVVLHGADRWQAAGYMGAGVKVGIIDGGFVGLTSRLGRELPATVHARCYREVGLYSSAARSCEAFTEHGTAVAETIADMAPGVSLYLADPVSMQDLASSVQWMTDNGVAIINISLGFAYQGPGDGTSPPDSIYSIVDQAVAGGALWVNAAGNSAEDGWSGTWKDADHDERLEFSGTDESNSLALNAGDSILVTLRWDDPWGASANDYDLYLFGPNGSEPVAASDGPQNGGQDPVETLAFAPASSGIYRIVIERASGTAPSALQLLVLTSQDTVLQYRTAANTLPSPADSANPGMVSVGAISHDLPDVIEPYSSRGPTTDNRIKPDFVAADCTATTVINPFCGTSESAPYAAGAAALVLSSRPSLTPAQLATWLRSHAVPLGGASPNSTYGWGRLDLGAPPAPPAPATVTFVSQPGLAVADVPLSPPPGVRILDQDGLPIVSGPGSTMPVTLGLAAGSAAGTVVCDGGLTRNAVAGVATFTGCTIGQAGSGAVLVATSGGLPPASSAPFEVLPAGSAPAPDLLLAQSQAAIIWGNPVTLTVRLAAPAAGPLPGSIEGRSVTIERSLDRQAWSSIGLLTTDASGAALLAYRPPTNFYYRAVFTGSADLGSAASGQVRVTVRQLAVLRPTNAGRTRAVALGQAIIFTTLVRPARSDVPPGTAAIEIYRRVNGAWRLVRTESARPDASGSASISVTFDQAGDWYVRAQARPTPRNANSFWTAPEQFLVR